MALLFDIINPDFKSVVYYLMKKMLISSHACLWFDIINPSFISCVYDLKSQLHDLNLTFRFDIIQIMI